MTQDILPTERFAPCPICKQYSHSIGEDQLAQAFMHFQSMFSHRGDGIPTQHTFDEATRDAAQVLMSAARHAATARAEALEEAWQPIETAPKDGTHVVVYAPRGQNGKPRRSRRGCFANVAHFEPAWGWLTSPSDYQIVPTHWMPLPPPPKAIRALVSDDGGVHG